MPTTYAGANSYPTSLTIPSDGDGPGIKAADVNVGLEALGDRTTWLKNRAGIYLRGEGHLEPASGAHTWPNTSGSFLPAEQLGLRDTVTAVTPFSAGVVAGDLLEIDFAASFLAYSNEAGNYWAWSIRLLYSETATDFVSGTWFMVESSASVSQRFVAGTAGPTVPDGFCVSWSCRLAPLGTTGHVRFAVAADRGGADEDLTALNCGGRWRWMRST